MDLRGKGQGGVKAWEMKMYWGEVPALPGCYSQGETIEELKQNIREAIAGVLEVLKEQGKGPDTNIQILDVAV